MLQKGFTLIEVMIVVAIIGILAAIAYPSYLEYVLKSDRAEGKVHLLSAMQAQERIYSQTMSYVSNVANLTGVNQKSEHNKYTLSINNCTGNADTKSCVIMLATPTRADPNCAVLSIDSRGVKATTGTKGVDYCW